MFSDAPMTVTLDLDQRDWGYFGSFRTEDGVLAFDGSVLSSDAQRRVEAGETFAVAVEVSSTEPGALQELPSHLPLILTAWSGDDPAHIWPEQHFRVQLTAPPSIY